MNINFKFFRGYIRGPTFPKLKIKFKFFHENLINTYDFDDYNMRQIYIASLYYYRNCVNPPYRLRPQQN